MEVVPGIASVEYGDLTNGVVKVKTRRGSSPFIVEGSINQHTPDSIAQGCRPGWQCRLIELLYRAARSFLDAALALCSPINAMSSLRYMNVFKKKSLPLTLEGIGMVVSEDIIRKLIPTEVSMIIIR